MEDSVPPPVPGWVALLNGEEYDLTIWEQSLTSASDPWFERISRNDSHTYALHSQSFVQARTADDVRSRALPLIAQLNGALGLLRDTEPLKFEGVAHVDSNGQLQIVRFAELNVLQGRSILIATAQVRDENGNLTLPAPHEPSLALKWIKAAGGSTDIAKTLAHFAQTTNWLDMWTTYEFIEDDVFGRTPKAQRPKGNKKKPKRLLLINRQWVLESDLCKFAESCNYHRHGAKKPPIPDESLTPAEARQILARILRCWLQEKAP